MYDLVYNVMYLFLFFFVASVIGYLVEVIFCSIDQKKLVLNRGFLIGPYIPIYGVGTITILFLLRKYFNDPMALFFLTTIVCSFIEYFTSWIMEKMFKVRWWDYTDKKFNIEGRVCLVNSLLFGLAGLIVVYFIYPLINNLLFSIPHAALIIISSICLIIFLTDLIITLTTLIGVRKTLADFKGKDATEIAREEVMKKIKKHSFLFNRLLKAFPHNEKVNNKEFREFKDVVASIRIKLKEAKQNFKDKTDEFKKNNFSKK